MTTKPAKQYFSFFYKSYSRYDPEGYRQKNSQNSKKKPVLKGCQSVATYVWITVSQDSPLKGRDCDRTRGRLAMLLQRGNAAILGNRVPTHPHPSVDGLE